MKNLIEAAQRGSKDAKEKIVIDNTGLIWSVVRRFLNRGYEADDLFQIGAIGLLKCVEKFDESFGVKFSTYAVPMIIGEIKKFLRDDGIIKVSRPLKEIAVKINVITENYLKTTGKSPTVEYLIKELHVSKEELIMAMESSRNIESLYQTINQTDGTVVYLIDKVMHNNNNNFDDRSIQNLDIKDVINQLSEKEKKIVSLRYFHDMTQSQVAKQLDMSQVQISRAENKILNKIREHLRQKK
jgi:RNA polymerase sporulation-specific sigma factor